MANYSHKNLKSNIGWRIESVVCLGFKITHAVKKFKLQFYIVRMYFETPQVSYFFKQGLMSTVYCTECTTMNGNVIWLSRGLCKLYYGRLHSGNKNKVQKK
jgi:hypothetical protein